jgi:hypothetical protein
MWTLTEHGKRIPLDEQPYDGDQPNGQFVLRHGNLTQPYAVAVPPDVFIDEPHYRSHFATCPDADRWRRS